MENSTGLGHFVSGLSKSNGNCTHVVRCERYGFIGYYRGLDTWVMNVKEARLYPKDIAENLAAKFGSEISEGQRFKAVEFKI